jgi:hypothetical protein
MGAFWDLFFPALIGAVVGGAVDLGYKRLEAKLRNIPLRDLLKSQWWRIFIYLLVIFVMILLALFVIYRYQQRTLWTFDAGRQSWDPLSSPADAAMSTEWDLNAKALRAEYNFAQTAPGDPDSRATFYYDNFNDTWAGYKTFQLDVTNPNQESLEMSFSVDIVVDDQRCFHEFGLYRNLLPGERITVSFDFTKPMFKICTFPGSFSQPLDPTQMINRVYLIVGTNESAAAFKGTILIDNILLQKDVWFLQIALGLVVMALISGIARYEYRRYLRRRDASSSVGKGEPDAAANI